MRVMQVVKVLRHGGAETVALRIMDAGAENQQAIVAAPGEWSDRFPGHHYSMGATSMRPNDLISASRSLRAAVKDFRPDVVHAHSPGTIVASAMALVGLRKSVTLVGTCHGGVPMEALARQAKLNKALRVPIVSCGPGVTAGLRAGGLEPVKTINNGIHLPQQGDRAPRNLAEEFGLDPSLKTIVAIGRLDPVKNQSQILKAMSLYPKMNLLVCGDGSSRQDLEDQAKGLKLSERVKFLGSRRDVSELVHAAGFQVLASRVEGLPVALLEGMAEGAAIVATDVLGTQQLIEEGKNGLLVPLDDEQALAEAFQRLDESEELRNRLSQGALETVQAYSVEAMTRDYWNLYRKLSARKF